MSGKRFEGVKASEGIALAKAVVKKTKKRRVEKRENLPVEAELQTLDRAVESALAELEQLYEETEAKVGKQEAKIFEAHQMILRDPELMKEIQDKIRAEKVNADWAVHEVLEQYISLFQGMEDDYMRERAADMKDVRERVLVHVAGETSARDRYEEAVVIVAHDLSPSDTAGLDTTKVCGIVTEIGGRTSHSAIMARALGIPSVAGVTGILDAVNDGDTVVVDGTNGVVMIRPSEEEEAAYIKMQKKAEVLQKELAHYRNRDTLTRDGRRLELAANIGSPSEISAVVQNGAEGIGLFRTEFLFMDRDDLPDEKEQYEAYKQAAEAMKEKPVIIRTLDIGGDKQARALDLPQELNPFLGFRAIRFCLEHETLFKTQLRAILRASAYGKIKMMYPMVATLEEVRRANALLDEAKEELQQEGISFDPNMEVGMMVEIPAAAVSADMFADEVDFFSIGTNDLIQYTLACDRMNETIAHLYQPFHPAVLRLVDTVVQAAHRKGKWVGMCGEMAGDLEAIPLLIGLGLDELSMSAPGILQARRLISGLDAEKVKNLAQNALLCRDQEEVKRLLTQEKIE